VVLVCEHASHYIPSSFNDLGLSKSDRVSHAAWDPGALEVALGLSTRLDATLVAGQVSRLVYDCNRPPDAKDAMPAVSEIIEVPGNRGLTAADHAARAETYYRPFHQALKHAISRKTNPVIVTIHSFTPIYHGESRAVEIGVLHDADTRLADAMIDCAPTQTSHKVERNAPYGPGDGVTHTLKEHGVTNGHYNVMLEYRSDLIASTQAQDRIATMTSAWLTAALAAIPTSKVASC